MANKSSYISLILLSSLLMSLVGCASRISIVEIKENYRDVKSSAPSEPGFESVSDALGKGFLGGFTPVGIMFGGPVMTGLLAAVSMADPCIDALRELDGVGPKLENIVAAVDISLFGEQLHERIEYFQQLERSKKFNRGGTPYREVAEDFILDVDTIAVVLRDKTGLDFACHPQVEVRAHWRLTKVSDDKKSYRQSTLCAGPTHQGSFLDWYVQPLDASQEISLLLGQLAQAVAAQVATGYFVNQCQ